MTASDAPHYEWLLSDHPDARAERDRRRQATYQSERERAAQVRPGRPRSTPPRRAPDDAAAGRRAGAVRNPVRSPRRNGYRRARRGIRRLGPR